jgi:hypothetical protein
MFLRVHDGRRHRTPAFHSRTTLAERGTSEPSASTRRRFLSATREHRTVDRRLADLDEPELVAMVDGNRATDLRRWCSALDLLWLEVVKVVAMLSPCASGALSRTP